MTPRPDANRQKLLRLSAPVLLLGVRSLGLNLEPDGDELDIVDPPKGVLTAELLELLKARKTDLLGALKSQPAPAKPPILGQPWEEFWRAQGVEEDDGPKTWRDMPITEKQRDLLLKGGEFNIPKTRGEASDRIKELIESAAFCDFLSLAELESFDHRAPGSRGRRRRFCCPLCGTNKDMDASHRSLSVDTSTGGYRCWRCGATGKLREYCGGAGETRIFTHSGPTRTEEKDEKWKRWWALAQPIRETDGAKYLERRGVPTDIAEAAGVRFGTWFHEGEQFHAVIFPVRDLTGKLIAAQARSIKGDIKNTRGPKSLGVFFTTPGRSRRLAVVEAPIDGLVLAACDLPAVALLGTTWPPSLPGALAGRDVALATDADDAGDKCARELGALLCGWRLRPQGAKDWAELAEREGLDAVYEQLVNAMERAPEVASR